MVRNFDHVNHQVRGRGHDRALRFGFDVTGQQDPNSGNLNQQGDARIIRNRTSLD